MTLPTTHAYTHRDAPLAPFTSIRLSVLLALLIAAALLLFRAFPQIDIAVATFFYDRSLCAKEAADAACIAFPLQRVGWVSAVRDVLHVLPVAVAVALLGVVAWRKLRGIPLGDPFNRASLAVIAALAISAGLIVNVILKNNWGRPRPFMTELFGGNLPFVLPGDITSWCERNCSFVSGEAAGSFWLIGAAALAPRTWRMPAMIVASIIAVLASTLRLSFGAHYLSDVTIGGLISLLVLSLAALVAVRRTTQV